MRIANVAASAGESLPMPGLWITGLGSAYPPHILGPEKLDAFADRFFDVEKPSLKKLLAINKSTGIESRASINDFETDFCCKPEPPTIEDLDNFFRDEGVALAAEACRKALSEWGGSLSDITHTVGVTCTSYGLPGYDLFVAQELGLSPSVERVLLGGVGCAGGLSIMRVAAQIACGAAARGRPARILAYACELCTPNGRHDLAEAEARASLNGLSVAAALFSDGAAAFVLCNDNGMDGGAALFRLHEWGSRTVPHTAQYMSFNPDPTGYKSVLSREIPGLYRDEMRPLFDKLVPYIRETLRQPDLDVADFDWAVHPGGKAIIDGVRDALGLTEEQLRTTQEIYKTRGNSSSPSVLIVLDRLRETGRGRDPVAALSFGPGLALEMALLERCR